MTTALDSVLHDAALLVTCGPGGVGKTTTAAALALAAADAGRRVIVVTVDPARRLADTLGIDGSARSHDPSEVVGATTNPNGSLWALMLDAESTFDRMITDRAGDEQRAKAILANPIYRSIAGSLGGAQEYMAIERLHQLWSSGEFDLIVIDTPPSRHAIDLLGAPDRLVTFFSHPVYRILTMPGRSFARVTNAGSATFLWAVRKLAGPKVVEDIIEFFRSLSSMEAGLRQRAAEAAALLRGPDTAFVLVSSPRAEAIDEATHLAEALLAGKFPLRATVVNLVHPTPLAIDAPIPAHLEPGPLADQFELHRELTELAADESREMARLDEVGGGVPIIDVPLLDDVQDLAGLRAVGEHLLRPTTSA
ncbi:MAG: ArsA-related P-loop ATPase [Actinomycetota bacterium]|nr:ArsA-related P-loop ATPase [Actinomycetota bacterium]